MLHREKFQKNKELGEILFIPNYHTEASYFSLKRSLIPRNYILSKDSPLPLRDLF